jgi:2-polyprenyl-3-methyl-5-hydroxy-6-metoxy-1,4-benzoquinol methylase
VSDHGDRAGKAHWDATWRSGALPDPVDPALKDVWHYPQRQFHRSFEALFPDRLAGRRLLEIGCARSPWLPYFASHFGADVTGLDYSEVGAALARQVLAAQGVSGEVHCADFFSPPQTLLGGFDVVTSFGVMEHFDDTAAALAAAARFLRPGGLLVTEIPNLVGAVGWLQKHLNRPVYDIHVPLDREALAHAHSQAGLRVVRCEYLALLQLGIVNLSGGRARRSVVRARLEFIFRLLSAGVWKLDEWTGPHAPGRLAAGYVLCAARLPSA